MIFKTCKTLNFLNKSHSAVLIKSTFEVLSTRRFINSVSPKLTEKTTQWNVPNKDDAIDIQRKVTEVVGEETAENIKGFFKLKKPNFVGVSFVWDNTYAKKIVKTILGNDQCDNCVVLEGNPGFGLITVNLINAGIPKVYIFQAPFSGTKLYEKYSDKIVNYHHSLFLEVGLQNELVLNVLEEASNSGKISKIIGVTTHHRFLSSLPRQIMEKNIWDLSDSTEFYIILSEQAYSRVTNYRLSLTKFYTYCLFYCLFDFELLDVYPSTAFLPVLETKAMYLVKIKRKPRESLPVNEDLIPEYATFLKILGSHKSNLIIQTLEQWVPGCGLNLITKGIRLTTEAKDISAEESIMLFNFFNKCEGYDNFKVMHRVLENEENERKGK